MLSGSNDRTARFWDLATMRQVGQPIEHDEMVLAVAFSPNGAQLCHRQLRQLRSLGAADGDRLRSNCKVTSEPFQPSPSRPILRCWLQEAMTVRSRSGMLKPANFG